MQSILLILACLVLVLTNTLAQDLSGTNVLVTGSSKGPGLGYFFLEQLQRKGYTITASARNPAKTQATVEALKQNDPASKVYGLPLDVSAGVEAIAASVASYQGPPISVVVLNAVKIPFVLATAADGAEECMSSKLIGHHILLAELSRQGKLAPDDQVKIIGVGSELSIRGGVPFPMNWAITHPDVKAVAKSRFDGDVQKTLIAGLKGDAQVVGYPFWASKYDGMQAYGQSTRYQNWYFQELARRKPQWKSVVISPGNIAGTDVAGNQPWIMQKMMPIMQVYVMGAQSSQVGTQRWLDFIEEPSKFELGRFFGSPHGRVEGPMGKNPNQEVDADLARHTFEAVEFVANSRLL